MFPTRLLFDTTNIPLYMLEFLEELARQYGVYVISSEKYVKLTQDEKTLDYITKRETSV